MGPITTISFSLEPRERRDRRVLLVSPCCKVTMDDGQLFCPNCGGGFSARPVRPAHLLARYPASTKRVLRPEGCAPA